MVRPDCPTASRRVLVVDDEPHIRRLVRVTLTRAGFEVETASSVEDAITQVVARAPGLVITDYAMGKSTGIDLCLAMRARPETRDIPVVLVTGYSHELEGTGLRADHGVACVFEKPFSPSELVETVAGILADEWPVPPSPHLRVHASLRTRDALPTETGKAPK